MPRLWSKTIESHRETVRDAIVDAAGTLVMRHGVTAVKMAQIAEEAGIGRATLYKYFPDVESVLFAWHERHVAGHLQHLLQLRDRHSTPEERLTAVLTSYALLSYRGGDGPLTRRFHSGGHVAVAQQQLVELIRELLQDLAEGGELRGDIPVPELATYCLHALEAAQDLRSEAAARRLVTVTLAGLGMASIS